MKDILDQRVKDIMTANPISAYPKMIMSEVCKIFEEHSFHHLPVIDDTGVCVGIISRSDYLQLQNNFTRMNVAYADKYNEKFFKSLLASEVMTVKLVSMDVNDSVRNANRIFLENRIHSVVVTDNNKCVGIITPLDILSQLNEMSYA